jgi:leucyl-tRNA synthetase
MNRSIILGPDGQKMSKSHGNVIDPDEVVERLGADTVRMYLAFIGPYNEVSAFPWNPDGVVGVRRFLERVWRLQEKVGGKGELSSLMHKTIKKAGEDILAMKFNTAISQMMILLNELEKQPAISKEEWGIFLTMLAPFAPHMAEELWGELGHNKSVHLENWPSYDEKKLIDQEVTYGIQIDGKTRGEVTMPADADKTAVEEAARKIVEGRLEGREIMRVIVVPKRLVNFVMKN